MADTLAISHLPSTSASAGAAAESVATKKVAKYSSLSQTYHFIPIACETLGPMNATALNFLSDLGRRITAVTGDPREKAFLFQRLSIAIQRFNGACFLGSFILSPDLDG